MIEEVENNLFARKRNTETVESILSSRETMPMANESCGSCGTCVKACPSKAITVDGTWKVDLGKCLLCAGCLDVCPNGCIQAVSAPDYALSREDLVFSRDSVIEDVEKPLDPKTRKLFGRSVSLRELDTGSCEACETDLNCMSNQFYDMHRLGIKIAASPRHADGVIVTGPMCRNMMKAAQMTFDAVPDPKLVIASGVCAISGGLFVEGDVAGEGTGSVLQPDIYIPGCPPSPGRVIRALAKSLGLH